ncbi:MAG: sugar phosphate isomerase/epimerase [Bryobacter sp.]|jgi:sugar phosphate isomerase/epimerase|nr:sugar phosphate isomerase/epimerase [Bryobacter sp.]
MRRRALLLSCAAALSRAASRLPANRNVKWALSLALWNHFPKPPLTDIFDLMRDTGFIGIRFTQFPSFLKTYNTTEADIAREMSRRGLAAASISFSAPLHDTAQQKKVIDDARTAIAFLKRLGASHLVVFSPGVRSYTEEHWRNLIARCHEIGEIAGEQGFTAGLHNHLDQMVEQPAEVHRFLADANPKLFGFSPDTAHLHLAGANVPEMIERYKSRIRFLDYKDARWVTPAADYHEANGTVYPKDSRQARFLSSIHDFGDGAIDFAACHRSLRSVKFQGWICVDLDAARRGPRASYERCGRYVVETLEPVYA